MLKLVRQIPIAFKTSSSTAAYIRITPMLQRVSRFPWSRNEYLEALPEYNFVYKGVETHAVAIRPLTAAQDSPHLLKHVLSHQYATTPSNMEHGMYEIR